MSEKSQRAYLECPALICAWIVPNDSSSQTLYVNAAEASFVREGLPMKATKASLKFIRDNLHRDLHLTEIASVLKLSPIYFVRLEKSLQVWTEVGGGRTSSTKALERRVASILS
jgi:hypothetical protein